MKRSKLGAAEQGRRARLQTSIVENIDTADPLAAAAHAKKAREEARIKAAAEAAAKAFAGKTKTVFYDNKGTKSPEAVTDRTPSASDQDETAPNPLAAILGYEQDDSASEDGSEPPSPRQPGGPTSHTPEANGFFDANRNGDEDDPMLASFMSELESSGLLDKEPEQVAPPKPPTPGPAPSTSSTPLDAHTPDESASPSTGVSPAGQEAVETSLAATIVSAVTDDQAEVPQQGDGSDASEEHTAGASGDAAASTEAAEQRVLGELEGAPTWHEVMDMASGKVYFWDSATDEVAWEAPPGAQPRSKHDNAATFAAHVSPAATRTADTAGIADTAGVASGAADGPSATTSSGGAQDSDAANTAAAVAAADDKQCVSASDGSLANTGPSSEGEDHEDGQLAEVRSASSPPAGEQPPQLPTPPPPDPQLGELGQQLVDQLRQSTHRLCRNIPQLVRLAVEAELRLQDWHMFSTKQQQAAEASQAQTAVSWTDVQDHLRWRWQSITAALPTAVEEAQQLHTRMDQELEAGEMPPLPSEDSATAAAAVAQLPSDPTAALAHAADTAEVSLMSPASASAVLEGAQGMPMGEGGGPEGMGDPTEAPPLPAEDPTASPAEAAPAGASTSPSAVAAAGDAEVDGGDDMDLDMDVDTDTHAGRPASEMTGQDATAAAGAALPDWAGYYMAHGYTYPYYGQAASASTSTSQPAAATSAQPTSGAPSTTHPAADLLTSRLATSTPPAGQGGSPAPPQLPVPLKKKRYQAEPAPSAPSPSDVEVGSAADSAAVDVHPSLVTDKQVLEAEAKKRKRPKAPVGLGQLAAKKKKSTKGISSMIDKWQAVRKEEEDEQAKAEEELDPAVQERRRLEQAEKWRLQQLKAGASSEENANFQPLSVDWREKLKANRKASSKGAPSRSSPDPAFSSPAAASAQADVTAADVSMAVDGKPNLELLSKGLPAGWRAMWDKVSGDIYYGNPKTRLNFEKDTYTRQAWRQAASTLLSAQNNLPAVQRKLRGTDPGRVSDHGHLDDTPGTACAPSGGRQAASVA